MARLAFATLLALSFTFTLGAAPAQARERLIVLTDIEADPDDTQSLVRLLLYANEIDLEGLVATTSIHMRNEIHPESIRAVIDEYAKVRANLLLHAPGYPTADALRARIREGQPSYGMDAVGAGKDTAGSKLIVSALESADPRPLWVAAWGGPNTLAQALSTIRATRGAAEASRLIAKLRVYTISDQDDSGAWMRREFPELFYIVSPGGYGAATWTGIHTVIAGADNGTIANAWLAEHIQQSHGPLGAAYPDVAYGMEGDTPSFLALIPNGLNQPERPDWGGWGGRYTHYTPQLQSLDPDGFTGGVPVLPETRSIWTNAIDAYTPDVAGEFGRSARAGTATFTGYRETLWRWRDEIQNDFAARMDWTIKPARAANHPPVPALRHPDQVSLRSGETFLLDAGGSTDPDGDSLSFRWFHYPEAGSLRAAVKMDGADNLPRRLITAPQVSKPETAHFILKVTDKGSPALTRYRRVIVTIAP